MCADPAAKFRMNLEEIDAVVDSNVMFDAYSGHDILAAYDKIGGSDPNAPELVYRRARARDALLLAIHFHQAEATTYSLHNELTTKILKLAPPDQVTDFRMHFTTFFVWFVREMIIPGWKPCFAEGNDAGPKGTACDTLLLEVARDNKLPLITNEGYSREGIKDEKLRARAKKEGVAVYTPREFLAGKIDGAAAITWFLHAFASKAEAYIAQHKNPEVARDSLLTIEAMYRHVLLGHRKEGPPVRVTI